MSEYEDVNWEEIMKSRACPGESPQVGEENECEYYGKISNKCNIQEIDATDNDYTKTTDETGHTNLSRTIGRYSCQNCGQVWDRDPRNKITTIANKVEAKDDEDPSWAGTCLFVGKVIPRPERKKMVTQISEARQLQRETERLRVSGWAKPNIGMTTKSDDYIEMGAVRDAGALLGKFESSGFESSREPLWAKLCPPFSEPTDNEEKEKMDIQIVASQHIHGSNIPRRRFVFQGSRNCSIPSHNKRVDLNYPMKNDKLIQGTRIGLEILFRMEKEMRRPWSISDWSKRFPRMTERNIAVCLIQGGPLSSRAYELMKNRKSDSIDVNSLIKGFLDNLNDLEVIKLSDEEMKEIQQNSENIHSLLSELEKDGKNMIQFLLDYWCILGPGKKDDAAPVIFEPTTFWSIGVGKQCLSMGPVHHPTILVGLIVAQALYNKNYRNCNQHKTVLNNVVFVDNKWTGNKRDDMIFTWGGIMAQIEVETWNKKLD